MHTGFSRETRDEWSKIQGRFVDLAVNADRDEQIDLISRAIECGPQASEHKNRCNRNCHTDKPR